MKHSIQRRLLKEMQPALQYWLVGCQHVVLEDLVCTSASDKGHKGFSKSPHFKISYADTLPSHPGREVEGSAFP